MLKFAVIIVAILALAFIVDILLSNSIGKRYRLFVAPGVILHELSHAFMCFFTGAPVTGISMFKKEGGEVRHGKSKIPILGPILISIAPFITGAVTIYFLSKIVGIDNLNIQNLTLSPDGVVSWVQDVFNGLDIASYKTWVGIYLILSIAVTMTPSLKDVMNMLFSLIVVIIAILLVYFYTAFRPDLTLIFTDQLFVVLASITILLIFSLILSIVVFVIAGIFKQD